MNLFKIKERYLQGSLIVQLLIKAVRCLHYKIIQVVT